MTVNCGNSHFKLACWIIGIVASLTVSISAYTIGKTEQLAGAVGAIVEKLETRVRETEKSAAANAVRFEEIKRSLSRIENQRDSDPR